VIVDILDSFAHCIAVSVKGNGTCFGIQSIMRKIQKFSQNVVKQNLSFVVGKYFAVGYKSFKNI
jgi:hypothetical protein